MDTKQPVPEIPAPPAHARRHLASLARTLGPLGGLVAIYIFFSLMLPTFGGLATLDSILRQSVVVGTAAIGMTLIIISGGIDLSVGATIALSTVVVARLLSDAGFTPLQAVFCGIGTGVVVGAVIGSLVTRLKVVPFIVTLGMMLVVRGLAKGVADEQTVRAPVTWINQLTSYGSGVLFPAGVWLMLGLAALVAALLRYTVFGRHIFAVGSNPDTARLCGVRVRLTQTLVYMLGGAFAGLAGVMQFSRLTLGDPTAASGYELDVIAAVVIGGGSLNGGEGSILGALVGALIMTTIDSGCSVWGRANYEQEIVTGVIIIAAVAIDRLRSRGVGN